MYTFCFKSLTRLYWSIPPFIAVLFVIFFCPFVIFVPFTGEKIVYIGLIHSIRITHFNYWQTLLIFVICYSLVIYCIRIILELLALKKLHQLALILYNECNPQKYCLKIKPVFDYLSQENRLLAKRCRKVYHEMKLLPTYTYCLIASDERTKGMSMLETYLNTPMKYGIKSIFPSTITDAQLVLLGYYCSTQRVEKAQSMQRSLLQALEEDKKYFSSEGELATYYRTAAEALIHVLSGNVETAVALLSSLQCHCHFPWQNIQMESYISYLKSL